MRDAAAFEAALRRYAVEHPREQATVRRFVDLLDHGPAAFHRDHLPGHFVASALVLDRDLTRVLLTRHRKLGIWIQLGGHVDGDLDLRRAAQREAVEESGLADIVLAGPSIVDVDIHRIPPHGGDPAHEHYDVRFAFFADPRERLVVSDESHDLAWVPVEQLGEYSREESLRRAVRKALHVLPAPVAPGNRDSPRRR